MAIESHGLTLKNFSRRQLLGIINNQKWPPYNSALQLVTRYTWNRLGISAQKRNLVILIEAGAERGMEQRPSNVIDLQIRRLQETVKKGAYRKYCE